MHKTQQTTPGNSRQSKSFAKASILWQSVKPDMRRSLLLSRLDSLCLWPCLASLAQNSPVERGEIVARVHFVGFDQLKTSTNAATLSEIWDLPETTQLRAQIQDKLARSLAASFQTGSNGPAADTLACRPLPRICSENHVSPQAGKDYRSSYPRLNELFLGINFAGLLAGKPISFERTFVLRHFPIVVRASRAGLYGRRGKLACWISCILTDDTAPLKLKNRC